MIEAAHRHRWPILAAMACVLIALHMMPADFFGLRIDSELFDLAHPIVFALVAFGVARYLTRNTVKIAGVQLRPILATVLGVGAFAFLSEASQVLSSRDASVGDLFRDAFGISSGIAFAYGIQRHRWQRGLLWTLGLAVLMVASWGPGRTAIAMATATYRFPVVADFEGPLARSMVRRVRARFEIIDAPEAWPRGGHVLRVDPSTWSDVSGIAIHGTQRDIRDYAALTLDIATADDSMATVRIRVETDSPGSRKQQYQVSHEVSGSPETIRIPLADIAASLAGFMDDPQYVRSVIVFADTTTRASLLIDDVKFE